MTIQGKCPFSRRAFLKIAGLLGGGALADPLLSLPEAQAFLFNKREYKVSATRLAMGTFVALTAIHHSRDQAEEAFGLAFEEVNRLSAILSRHDQNSPVAELNKSGVIKEFPAELAEVVSQSLHFFSYTGGAFDISVKPLLDLYQTSFSGGTQPTPAAISRVLDSVDATAVRMDAGRVRFAKNGMGITLDGIAKGYIVDKISELLVKNGVENHLINAGGDIRANGVAAKGRKWKIAIQDPNKQGTYPDVISLGSGSIATSGNYEIYYDEEKVFHHIVNPETGRSPQFSASVSILAPSVTEADALSTAVFVLEPEDGVAFIDSCPEYECFVIDRSGTARSSAHWGRKEKV